MYKHLLMQTEFLHPSTSLTSTRLRERRFTVLARASHNDNVDTTDTTTFEVEMSKAGQNQWDQGTITGGDSVVYEGSSNEGRVHCHDQSIWKKDTMILEPSGWHLDKHPIGQCIRLQF